MSFVLAIFFKDVFEKYGQLFEEIGVDSKNGLGDVYAKVNSLPDSVRKQVVDDIEKVYTSRPELAMVNSEKGITNLHVPSDVIIDASMPAMIRSSGKMWNKDGNLQDAKAVIPDRCYAGIYLSLIHI